MEHGDYIVYVDESGDHSMRSIDRDYPIFVLACCIFRKEDYYRIVSPRLQSFKFKHFGHDIVVLHERDIRMQRRPFIFLKSQEKRSEFLEDLNRLIVDAPFVLVSAVIEKEKHRAQYVDPVNPYSLALQFCLERTYAFLRDQGQHQKRTHIVVERRGQREDDELELVFRRVCAGAGRWGEMPGLDIIFADKRTNSAGLQFADLIARPIGRHVLKPGQENRAYEIIVEKFRTSPGGRVAGWGLKVFP